VKEGEQGLVVQSLGMLHREEIQNLGACFHNLRQANQTLPPSLPPEGLKQAVETWAPELLVDDGEKEAGHALKCHLVCEEALACQLFGNSMQCMNNTQGLEVVLLVVVLTSAAAGGRTGWKEGEELREEVRPFPRPVGADDFGKDVCCIFGQQIVRFCHAGQQKSTQTRLFLLADGSGLLLLLLQVHCVQAIRALSCRYSSTLAPSHEPPIPFSSKLSYS
jgi:hypothetical protein